MGRISQNSSFSSRLQDAQRYQEGPLTLIIWTNVQDTFTGQEEPQAATINVRLEDLATSPIRYTSTPLSPEHATILPSAFFYLREALATERLNVLEGLAGQDTGELDGGIWWGTWFLEDALPLALPVADALPEPAPVGPPADPYGFPDLFPDLFGPDLRMGVPEPEPEPCAVPEAAPPTRAPVPEPEPPSAAPPVPEPYVLPEAAPPVAFRPPAHIQRIIEASGISALISGDYPTPGGQWGAPDGWFLRGPGF
jgi:hypothetical protein